MKSIFSYLFNVLRNVSLILVLLFLATSFLVIKYPALNNYLQNPFATSVSQQSIVGNNMSSIPDSSFNTYSGEKEKLTINGITKIKIEIHKGLAYLNPSDILYINTNEIKLVTGESYDNREALKSIREKLKGFRNHHFFSTRLDIINCYFITAVTQDTAKYNYQEYVRINDTNRISISKERAEALRILMDKLSL